MEYIYLLTKGGEEIEVLYDLKEALLKAQEMSLTLYRIRLCEQGVTVMKIFTVKYENKNVSS